MSKRQEIISLIGQGVSRSRIATIVGCELRYIATVESQLRHMSPEKRQEAFKNAGTIKIPTEEEKPKEGASEDARGAFHTPYTAAKKRSIISRY